MVGSNVVKAQIKLSFRSAETKDILAMRFVTPIRRPIASLCSLRHADMLLPVSSTPPPHALPMFSRDLPPPRSSFQVSQNARTKKLQFKQLEGILRTRDDNGELVTTSNGCAEMDKQMPSLLGVSRAVLENVIFCHQEESLWPLGDANTLKANFDAIFSATRYSKALETIRKLRKEHVALAKDLEADLRLLLRDQEQAEKLRGDLSKAQESLEGFESKIEEAKAQQSVRCLAPCWLPSPLPIPPALPPRGMADATSILSP